MEKEQMYREQISQLADVLETISKGFRALEFMGRHSHGVTSGDKVCAQCAKASLDSYVGVVTVDQAADMLCDDLKAAITQYKVALEIVKKWESKAR
jgi:hypothetical protein